VGGTEHHGVVLAVTDRASSASKPRKDGASLNSGAAPPLGLAERPHPAGALAS
jgi:hypothetical protein